MAFDEIKLVYAAPGIATAKEPWLFGEDVTTEPDKEEWLEKLTEEKIRREMQSAYESYIRNLAEENEKRLVELAAVKAHARLIGEHALMLQQEVEARAREQAEKERIETELEREFNALADQWRQETMKLSSDSDIVTNFAYQQIIGMGEKALPFIFRDLQNTGGRWFWALRAITRQNPVRREDRGNVRRMVQTWLEWGRQYGYVR